jgi:metal-responsive CopG/Arc/MetJ family transcriptional regulator
MPRSGVNLYLDEELFQRFKTALQESTGQSVSQYIEHAMREDLELIELAAKTKDRQKVAQLAKEKTVSKLTDELSDQFSKLSDFLRIISDEAEGKEHPD